MKIKLEGEFKSLNSFESDRLSDFTVITGKNGSGKSQLIEVLNIYNSKQEQPEFKVSINPEIVKIQIGGFTNNNFSSMSNHEFKQRIDRLIMTYIGIPEHAKILAELLLNNNVWVNTLTESNFSKSIKTKDKIEVKDILTKAFNEYNPHRLSSESSYVQNQQNIDLNFLGRGYLEKDKLACELALHVSRYRKKDFHKLKHEDFYLTPLPPEFYDETKLYSSRLEIIFYNYVKSRDQNSRLYYDKKEYGDDNNSISDEDFVKTNKPPWELVNEIFINNNLNFKFKGIERKDFSIDAVVSFDLIKNSINKSIEFQHLSSGEKIIIGLILKLFTSSYYGTKLEFPELIVLDEPDAFLHPEMTNLLLQVLNETFVKKFKIKVIITTHSPSTIALCPEDSIFQITNEPETRLTKVNKDEALEILTEFLPTLSIDYKNHKQVFVESPTDLKYYQTVFNRLNQSNNYPNKLYFISYSSGKGNSDQVKKIVNDLRHSGNKTSFGIIDWDLKNVETDKVLIHGKNNRYSIEQYVFDPVYICVLFMEMGGAQNVYSELDLNDSFNHYLIGNETEEKLQVYADWIFDKINDKFRFNQEKSDSRKVYFQNEKSLSYPRWFLDMNGHDFEEKLKKTFPSLQKYRNSRELSLKLIQIIAKCYPFIPIDTVKLFDKIIYDNEHTRL